MATQLKEGGVSALADRATHEPNPQAVSAVPVGIANALAKLREPFPPNQISKLPKPYKKDSPKGKCSECGGYHGLPAVHLDYVGHAALTDRLLDTDPYWNWEPMGLNPDGTPALDANGGLWIRLTVCGMTRPGYGCADGKRGGDAIKEIIGDALRNAAMRFGAALDLWHKGDLHVDDEADEKPFIKGQFQEAKQAAHEELREQLEQSIEKPVSNWGGRYPTKTALKKAMHTHHAELDRLGLEGTFDDLDAYLTAPEYQDYVAIAAEHHPLWLEGAIPDDMRDKLPEGFVQTFTLEQKARDMIAIRGNVSSEPEPA